jgi:hypothetical protein
MKKRMVSMLASVLLPFSDSGTSSTGIFDTGTVRVGALSPSFPANRSGPPKASDTSKVRIGALSPAFPALRTK